MLLLIIRIPCFWKMMQLSTLAREVRMPTYEEFKELLSLCDFKYAQYGDMKGSLLTSKVNGARIFLPHGESSVSKNSNTYVNYWSSNVNSSATGQSYRAHYYNFSNGGRGYMAQYERYNR